MLVKKSLNLTKILLRNVLELFVFIVISLFAYGLSERLEMKGIHLKVAAGEFAIPSIVVATIGTALAFFLGLRNNKAISRWEEARSAWGGMVNYSRSFATMIIATVQDSLYSKGPGFGKLDVTPKHKDLILRHIIYLKVLKLQLRENDDQIEGVTLALSKKDKERITNVPNAAAVLNLIQIESITSLIKDNLVNEFGHDRLLRFAEQFYNFQGTCERIKNTPFPRHYSVIANIFLWLFCFIFPFAIAQVAGILTLVIGPIVSMIYLLAYQVSVFYEEPFSNTETDIPLTAIVNTIERDLLSFLNDENHPIPLKEQTKNGYLW